MLIRILAVDDDPKLLDIVKESLSREGFRVTCTKSPEEALETISKNSPDLLILDWKFPDRDGAEICRLLRNDPKTAGLPIIMLTSVTDLKQKVDALEGGADDYITKPFHLSELRARVRAVLRRKTPWLIQDKPLEFKDLKLDPTAYKAYVQGKDTGLTKIEFEILYLLAVNPGRIMQRSYIENRVLDMDYPTESRPLDVHLSHLREKLGSKVGRRIETSRGLGYIFNGDAN